MIKVVSSLLVSSLLMSAVVPISNVKAKDNNNTYLSTQEKTDENLSNVQFEPIVDNEVVTNIRVTYANGKTSLSEYNKKTGEVFFDGELVAKIKEAKSSGTEEPLIFKEEPTAFSIASVQQFTVGLK